MSWFGNKKKKRNMVDKIYEAQGAQKKKGSRCPHCGQPVAMKKPEGTLGAFFSCPKCGKMIGL